MADEFEELSQNAELISRIRQFRDSIARIDSVLNLVTDPTIYEKLSNKDKINYNLLMTFSLNSMFWMYLRAEGIDPTEHEIKSENTRFQNYISRAKQINDKKTLMPHVNKDVAQRLIRNSLWEPKNNRKRRKSETEESEESEETCKK